MAPPFSSCLAFVFLTGHSEEDIFFLPVSLLQNTASSAEGFENAPKAVFQQYFPIFKVLCQPSFCLVFPTTEATESTLICVPIYR